MKGLGRVDVVHSTGIFYHLASVPDALWSLRSIVGEYLITNTITFPTKVENKSAQSNYPIAASFSSPQ